MMDAGSLGKWLVVIGLIVAVLGVLVWLAARLGFPLGRLPGDLRFGGNGWSVSIPIVTCIVLSLLLTLLLNLVARWFR